MQKYSKYKKVKKDTFILQISKGQTCCIILTKGNKLSKYITNTNNTFENSIFIYKKSLNNNNINEIFKFQRLIYHIAQNLPTYLLTFLSSLEPKMLERFS